MSPWTSERPSSCPSGLALDEWLAGELAADRVQEIDAHVRACTRCRTWRAAREQEQAAFLTEAPSFAEHAARWGKSGASVGRSGRSRRTLWLGSFVAAAAAVVAIVLVRHPGVDDATVRLKGQPHLTLFVQHDQQVRRGANGEVVRPGDKIRFAYTAAEPRHLAIIGLDARGTAERYFPMTGATTALDPGSAVTLPFAVELDEILGRETLFGLFCLAPIDVDTIVRGLGQSGHLPELPACSVDRVQLHKGSR